MDNKEHGFGYLLINKPEEITSHGVVSRLRKITGIKKIGHAGTLDPFATGLLILAIGRKATKNISKFVKLDKEYVATLFLGAETDTYDKTGKTVLSSEKEMKSSFKEIDLVVRQFIGPQLQIPPMFSAKKIKGKKLYELARKGVEVERRPAAIEIFALEIVGFKWPYLEIKVHCSSGTYIRSIAYEIGKKLGCGAYLEALKRTKIGDFSLKNAKNLDDLNTDNWVESIFQQL